MYLINLVLKLTWLQETDLGPMLSYLILGFLPFIKHDALSLSAKDDMRYEKVR